MTWFKKIPKLELHVHLEGAIPHKALFDLIQKYGGDSSIPDITALRKRFKYKSFSQFLKTWSWKDKFLRNYEDFEYIAELTARDMVDQNIHYAEMFFSPSPFVKYGLVSQKLVQAIRKGLSKVPEIEIALIADLVRDYGPIFGMKILNTLNEVKECGIIGIGIGGSEHKYPPEPFSKLYQEARNMGFRTTAHAGEASGPKSIWGAINELHVDRIGHGTRICEDPKLFNYILKNQIPIELCPVSNVRTGVVKSLKMHPIRKYFDYGFIISINTDDPKMFNTSVAEEYRLLVEECGFSKREICKIIQLGIRSSWMSEEKKQFFISKFEHDKTWMSIMG